jgi:hypothetical protein
MPAPKTVRMAKMTCPSCGKMLDAASDLSGSKTPRHGDLTVCIGCSAVLLFTGTMGVRAPDTDELAGIYAAQPGLSGAVARVKVAVALARK